MNQYEIWWADLPSPAGKRPVLLLSRSSAYGYLNKFIVAEITSNIRGIAVEVPLGRGEGLSKSCVANCDNLRMVSKTRLVKKAGVLRRERHIAVKRAVGYAFAWDELMNLA